MQRVSRIVTKQAMPYFVAATVSLLTVFCSAEESAFQPGLDLSLARTHQSFKNVSGTDISTVSLTPYLQNNNWFFTLDIPWQTIDGTYVLNNRQAPVPAICDTLSSLNPQQIANIRQRRENLDTIIERCSALNSTNTESDSGLGDIAIYASYGVELDQQKIWYLLFTTGLHADNADWEGGIGSGTQDLIGELALSANNGQWLGSVTLGYNVIYGGELEPYYDNYAYVMADMGTRLNDMLTTGIQADWTESSTSENDDITSASVYVSANITRQLNFRLSYKRFSSAETYPEDEIRGALQFSF